MTNGDEELSDSVPKIQIVRRTGGQRHVRVADVENPHSQKVKGEFGAAPTAKSRRILVERNGLAASQSSFVHHKDDARETYGSNPTAHTGLRLVKNFGTFASQSKPLPQFSPVSSYDYSASAGSDVYDKNALSNDDLMNDDDRSRLSVKEFESLEVSSRTFDDVNNSLSQGTDIYEESARMNSEENKMLRSSCTSSDLQQRYMAGMRQVTPPNRIEEIRHNVNDLEGGDAIFQVQLDLVIEKLVYALTDLDSAYLFRDFAGHFTEFLNRFGPGGYDQHRAPPKANWILNLLLPLIHADADSSDTQIRVYAEVSGWFRRMVGVLGWHNSDALFDRRGGWQRCVEHMSNSNPEISSVAFDTAETILRNVPLEFRLGSIIDSMQPFDQGLDDTDLSRFRLYRVKLFSVLLERVDSECRAGKEDYCRHFVPDIVRYLEAAKATETDLRVSKSIDKCLKYAHDTENLFSNNAIDPLSPRTRRPRLSLTFSKWQEQQQLAEQQGTEESKTKQGLFSRLFYRRSKPDKNFVAGNASIKTAHSTPDNRDAISVQTSRSTRTLRQKWRKLFSFRKSIENTAQDALGFNDDDAHTFITI